MQPGTALLVSSTDLNWVALRAILVGWPEVHVIDDVQRREYALPIAARERPDFILVASDLLLPCLQLVPLVRDLRTVSPDSQLVVFGRPLEPEVHLQLDGLDVAGFVQWDVVTPERVRLALTAVRAGDLYVGCKDDPRMEPSDRGQESHIFNASETGRSQISHAKATNPRIAERTRRTGTNATYIHDGYAD